MKARRRGGNKQQQQQQEPKLWTTIDVKTKSPRQAYLAFCEALSVPSNLFVRSSFSDIPGNFDLEELSLSTSLPVGPKAFKAILNMLPLMRRMRVFVAANNNINDSTVAEMCEALQGHPSITMLDLSGNPITDRGIRGLLKLATENAKITFIDVSGTAIEDHELLAKLQAVLAANAGRSGHPQEMNASAAALAHQSSSFFLGAQSDAFFSSPRPRLIASLEPTPFNRTVGEAWGGSAPPSNYSTTNEPQPNPRISAAQSFTQFSPSPVPPQQMLQGSRSMTLHNIPGSKYQQ